MVNVVACLQLIILETMFDVPPTTQPRLNFAGMHNVEDDHNGQHQHCIENIEIVLVAKYVPVVALDVLDNPKDGPNEDQDASCVQRDEVLMPRATRLHGMASRMATDGSVIRACYQNEEAEKRQLNEETSNNHMLASRPRIEGPNCHDTSAC
jgi:hypothetical protein